jgi:PAS domain S-box-containing protein
VLSSSNNIKKIRELVDQLCIRDTEAFKRLEILKLTLGYSTDGYWDWNISDNKCDNVNSRLVAITESINKFKNSTVVKDDKKFNFDLFFNSFISSPELIKHLGFDGDELKKLEFKELVNKGDLIELNSEINKHLESKGEYKFKSITRYKHKNGHTVKILSRGSVIEWDANKNPIRMVGTHIDITNL